jgi:hypothetical protein
MNADQGGSPSTPEERDHYRLDREGIAAEDLPVFHRLSWLLASQSILFGIWATAFFRQGERMITTAGTAALAGVGLATCLIIGAGLVAAVCAIDVFRRGYREHYPGGKPPNAALPPLVASTWTYVCGLLVPLCLTLLFIVGWIVVLAKFA